MASGSPNDVFAGAPKSIPGAPSSIPGAPLSVPGGPTQSYPNFLTTVPYQPTSGAFRDMHTAQIRNFQGKYAGSWGVAWQGLDAMSEGLTHYVERVEKARDDAMNDLADEMVRWAQENRVWEDRTTDAREHLHAEVISDGPRTVIWFGHGVPYGIWLETMQNGRFAIVLPTIMHFAPQIGGKVAAHV